MTKQQVNTIIGALVAIGLVIAVSYGFISQQTADQIKVQTDKTFSTGQTAPAPTGAPPQAAPQGTTPAPTAAPAQAAPQGSTPAPQQ